MSNKRLKTEVAATARMLSAAGLVEAFGHVSARINDGQFLITPTTPMLEAGAETIITVGPDGRVVDNPSGAAPLEIPLHAGVYRARPDVGAICRGHGPAMVAWGTSTDPVPLFHGLGAIAGEVVPVHPDLDLISTRESGDSAAATLSLHYGALLLANGGFAVGDDLLEAATRLWFLEERASVAIRARGSQPPQGDWEHRLTHTAIELKRAMAWFQARFSDQTQEEL